jgi:hypothetical protein
MATGKARHEELETRMTSRSLAHKQAKRKSELGLAEFPIQSAQVG